jgi:hypothetical protein
MAFQSKLKTLQPRRLQFQRKIKLLSGGYVKPDSFPNGEITVFPWDANVDDWLAERVRKGDRNTVLFDLCAQVCDLNGCPLDSFVIGDLNTVLLVARAIRYSSVVEYECACPNCGRTTTETITVPDELGRVGEKTADYPGFDTIVLPECQDEVQVRPLQIKDEKLILERDSMSKQLMTDRVMHILMPIVAINGGKPDAWEEAVRWYQALPPGDAQFLEDQQNELYPHLDTDIPHKCDDCRRQFKHKLEFTSDFFRSSLKPGHRNALETDVRSGVERQGAIHQPAGSPGSTPGPDGGVGERENRRRK